MADFDMSEKKKRTKIKSKTQDEQKVGFTFSRATRDP